VGLAFKVVDRGPLGNLRRKGSFDLHLTARELEMDRSQLVGKGHFFPLGEK
jgi:hypothetical protein